PARARRAVLRRLPPLWGVAMSPPGLRVGVALRVSGLSAPRAAGFPYPPGCCDPPGFVGGVPPDTAMAPPWRVGPPAGGAPVCTVTGASAGDHIGRYGH